ncbi:TAXI family TRAP transporter solute-binding subunit [Tropicibacter naphthalenivorans]|uniref:TRAP transporter solute receptor, TAXI family n=1 Tax=Tropicibacter naphthalenivorans TaxID=441103 RepID=A0A0P1GH30_9RHOB|nr:TAXI family TRAP transporter solute-binding subunit [Tropicibacter naphthalenivorans]CUH80984.1 TRAP transporter solute receptor, TAXI family [Tropicibacter naphthalenivorans]SMC91600.1 NMT1-like family protein [Tropicibacter naphthalenivorans]
MLRRAFTTGAAALAAFMTTTAVMAQDVSLPRTQVWTSYDVGTAGYVEASAMADALDKKFGTTVRIIPSGTSIGRLLPLQAGRASYGFMGNENYFAGEAMFEFGAREWGPQDLRVVLGRPSQVGLVTGKDTGIASPADLAGKKVGYVLANASTTLNTETVLAFAGLTAADVEKVEYPSYGAMAKAFVAGEIDVAPAVPTSSFLREAEGGRGVQWLSMPKEDTEGWGRVAAHASLFSHSEATVGVSISDDNPADLLGYRYPQLTVPASTSADEVYNMIKALDETFDMYKDASVVMPNWSTSIAGTTPAGAPFHDGAVRYLKEIGVWTDKDQQWNDARIAHIEEVKAAWEAATAQADSEGVKGADWPAYWEAWRAEHLN